MPRLLSEMTVTSVSTSTATSTEGTITNINNTYQVQTLSLNSQSDISNYVPAVGDIINIRDIDFASFSNKSFEGVTFNIIYTSASSLTALAFQACTLKSCRINSTGVGISTTDCEIYATTLQVNSSNTPSVYIHNSSMENSSIDAKSTWFLNSGAQNVKNTSVKSTSVYTQTTGVSNAFYDCTIDCDYILDNGTRLNNCKVNARDVNISSITASSLVNCYIETDLFNIQNGFNGPTTINNSIIKTDLIGSILNTEIDSNFFNIAVNKNIVGPAQISDGTINMLGSSLVIDNSAKAAFISAVGSIKNRNVRLDYNAGPITGVVFENCTVAVESDFNISNCTFEGCTIRGLDHPSGFSGALEFENCKFDHCVFENVGYDELKFINSGSSSIFNNNNTVKAYQVTIVNNTVDKSYTFNYTDISCDYLKVSSASTLVSNTLLNGNTNVNNDIILDSSVDRGIRLSGTLKTKKFYQISQEAIEVSNNSVIDVALSCTDTTSYIAGSTSRYLHFKNIAGNTLFNTGSISIGTEIPAFEVKGDMLHTELINNVMATGYAYATNDVTIKNKNIIMQASPSGANRLKFQNCDIAIADDVIIQGVDFTGSTLKMYGPYFGQTEVSISDSFIDSCSIDTIAQIIKFGSGVTLHRSTVSGDEVWWGVTTSSTNTITSSFSTVKAAKNIKFGLANNSGDYTIESSHFEAPSITISQGADRSVEVISGSSIKAETLSQTIHPVFTTSRFSLAIDASSIIEVNKSGSGYLKLEDYTNSGNIIFDAAIDTFASSFPHLSSWSLRNLKFDTRHYSSSVIAGLNNASSPVTIDSTDILLGTSINATTQLTFENCNIKAPIAGNYVLTNCILRGCSLLGAWNGNITFKGSQLYSCDVKGFDEVKLEQDSITTRNSILTQTNISAVTISVEAIQNTINSMIIQESELSSKFLYLDADTNMTIVASQIRTIKTCRLLPYPTRTLTLNDCFVNGGSIKGTSTTGSMGEIISNDSTLLSYNDSTASGIIVKDNGGNTLLSYSNTTIPAFKITNNTATDLDQI